MDIKELTCAERIADSLKNTEESLGAIYDAIEGKVDQESEESETSQMDAAYSELYEYALGIDSSKHTVITLSWGGPASYLEVIHRGTDIHTLTYRFSDWFDTATELITDEESAVYRYAQEMINIQEGEY